jgi:hypothetical protein
MFIYFYYLFLLCCIQIIISKWIGSDIGGIGLSGMYIWGMDNRYMYIVSLGIRGMDTTGMGIMGLG